MRAGRSDDPRLAFDDMAERAEARRAERRRQRRVQLGDEACGMDLVVEDDKHAKIARVRERRRR